MHDQVTYPSPYGEATSRVHPELMCISPLGNSHLLSVHAFVGCELSSLAASSAAMSPNKIHLIVDHLCEMLAHDQMIYP